jgi:hypothetical protein
MLYFYDGMISMRLLEKVGYQWPVRTAGLGRPGTPLSFMPLP